MTTEDSRTTAPTWVGYETGLIDEIEDTAHKQDVSPPPQTSRSVSFVELRQSLPTEIAIISPYVDQLMRFIARFRNADGSEWDIETALREALANAMVHGNQQDAHKRVYVACRCTTDGEVSITVQDEGSGFDCGTVPDPTTPDNLLRTYGRGIYLMRTLMDEVRFEQRGAVVYMRKKSNADRGAKQGRTGRPFRRSTVDAR